MVKINQTVGYKPPAVSDVVEALDGVAKARALLPGQKVTVQTDLGDVVIKEVIVQPDEPVREVAQTITNTGTAFFKVKSPDMLGAAQWTVLRNNRMTKVSMLHQQWLDDYHERKHTLLPGDSLKCIFEDIVSYDAYGNEIESRTAIIEVLGVISPQRLEQSEMELDAPTP
ncbi:MAG: hypothetical protein FWC38_09870 [Proteobacteria bacterium]|nr:hypothetical protein [Pseudomonadota bacterium]